MSTELFTIGHSTLGIERFCELLAAHGIAAVADVRSAPYSRWVPHFNREELRGELEQRGVVYRFLGAELGARSLDPAAYQDNRVSYDYIAGTAEFHKGLSAVVALAAAGPVAILCSEGDPIQCHRMVLVGRRLKARGQDVRHILTNGDVPNQSECEARLLEMHRLESTDLFVSTDEIVEQAYRLQGRKIAYVRDRAVDEVVGTGD